MEPNKTIKEGKMDGIVFVIKLLIALVSSMTRLSTSPLLFLSKKDIFNFRICSQTFFVKS